MRKLVPAGFINVDLDALVVPVTDADDSSLSNDSIGSLIMHPGNVNKVQLVHYTMKDQVTE